MEGVIIKTEFSDLDPVAPLISPLFLRMDTSTDIDIVERNLNRPNIGIFTPVGQVKEYLVETPVFRVVLRVVLDNSPVAELKVFCSDTERLVRTSIRIPLISWKLNDRKGF